LPAFIVPLAWLALLDPVLALQPQHCWTPVIAGYIYGYCLLRLRALRADIALVAAVAVVCLTVIVRCLPGWLPQRLRLRGYCAG